MIGTGQEFQRQMAGTVCETIYRVNSDSDRAYPWHFFTASPFGLRWESVRDRVQRILKYLGKDKKSLKLQAAADQFNDMLAEAKMIKAQKADQDDGEE